MIRHAGHALLLRLARARALDSYLNDETPFLLRKKLVKKSCAALEGREESDPQWEDVARRVNEAVGSLAEMLTADAAPLSAVEKAMDRVSVQYVAYKSGREFRLKSPVAVEHSIDTTKFFKLHCFRDNVYFDT